MSAFDYFQLLVDLVFLFLILVLLVGRGWKRGAGAGEQESYREMVTNLSALIREMKEASGELQEKISEKQVEVQHAVAIADEKIQRLKEVGDAAPARRAGGPAPNETRIPAVSGTGPVRVVPLTPAGPVSVAPVVDPVPAVPSARSEADDEERREKYRQALDFAEKGWTALDIARFTQLPRGEVELLIRTKGKQV